MCMNKTFIIAEAGVNHNGSEKLALELVDVASRSGADAIKFQSFKADKLVRRGASKAAYQQATTGSGDQHSMLAELEMSDSLHFLLYERCAERGIEFMSTPFDVDSADFLVKLGIKRIKIPSGEITNHSLIRHLASKNRPLILSTGMATLEEIIESTEVLRSERIRLGLNEPLEKVLTILHCTSNYPADVKDVNLRAMNTIAAAIGVPVGYSDHTLGLAVSTAAVAMGAIVIEKHFTLDRNLPGPDHKASLTPDELSSLVTQIREVEAALGSPEKRPTDAELPVRELVRRSVTTLRALRAGDAVSKNDLCLLRPGGGISPRELESVYGRIAACDIPAGTTLQWGDFF